MMRAEEKAARLPAIMTVPLILFILPVLFVVIWARRPVRLPMPSRVGRHSRIKTEGMDMPPEGVRP
jgi:nitrate/nitrite-specific signal transduction histidine kinase